jgi:hypothetical protein
MLDFKTSVLGLIIFTIGVFVIIYVTHLRVKGNKGGYGNHSKMYTGGFILIITGLVMLIRELMKL